MLRHSVAGAALLTAALMPAAYGQDHGLQTPRRLQPVAARPVAARSNIQPVSHASASAAAGEMSGPGYHGGAHYPALNAPMYPSPRQTTPPWTGGSVITNQALAPHEMLYPHSYHAMYPPFYYRVKGCWIWTPFGMRQHEKWELQGTQVKVNYRSSYAPFSGFHPPR